MSIEIPSKGAAEYIIAGVIVLLRAVLVWSKNGTPGGFIPFFYHWGEFFDSGLIDGHEWRNNRFNVI